MATRTKVMFIFAAIFAVLAVLLAKTWVTKQAGPGVAENVPTTLVVVAAMDIPYGQPIENVHLKLVPWPLKFAPFGHVGNVEDVLGKVALQKITTGDAVTTTKFADNLGGSRLAALLEPEKRAVTVRVNDVVGVAGFLLPDNRVDVLAVKQQGRGDAMVRTVLEDIKVLAVDQDVSPDDGKPKVVRAVTLELTPVQAEELVKVAHEGSIQLALRNPNDRAVQPPPPVVEREVVPERKVVVRRARTNRPPPYKVTVIRGMDVSEVKPKL